MTTLNIITHLIAVAALVFICWRVGKLVNLHLKEHADLRERVKWLSRCADEYFLCNYTIEQTGTIVRVWRCTYFGDRFLIKEFKNNDADFNRQQAEELLDKLNEK